MKNTAKHVYARRSLLVIISSLLTVPAQSTIAGESLELGRVVVTATRTERDISEVPASVSVITSEEIEKSTAQSADELLQGLAGVDVRHSMGVLSVGTSNKVTMRGMGGLTEARALMLIDGVPVNEVWSGGVEWNQIPVEDIERIEVVRGAGSALYGSNAMGGVINIITKKPSEETQTKVTLGYGSMDTKDGSASMSGSAGKWGYRLSGGITRSDGYQPLPENKLKATSIDKGAERENFRGVLSYDLTDSSLLSLTGEYYHHQTTGTYDIPGYNPFEQKNKVLSAKYNNRLGGGRELSATLYTKSEDSSYDNANYLTGYTTNRFDSVSEQSNVGGNLQYTAPFSSSGAANHVITTGLDFRQGEIDRQDTYYDGSGRFIQVKGSQRYAGLYAQDEIFLMDDDLVLNIGGRYDYWKNYDGYNYDTVASPVETNFEDASHSSFNPKLGAIYQLNPSTAIRGSVGKAFRAPNLYDLYRTYIATSTMIYYPNADLGPEKVLSYEVGLDQQLGDSATLSVTLYHNDAEDFISTLSITCTDPAFTSCYEKQNVGEVSTQGVEVDFRYAFTRHWGLSANYTYNRSEVEKYDPDPTLEGNLLPDTPEHKGALSLTFSDPSLFTAKVTARYVGERYSNDTNTTEYDSYTLVDLHLSKDVGKHYRLSLDVNDLFDKTYTEYNVSPGRTVMAKLTASF
ncbi:TonB-dependent siderophore receptor [Thiohalobacter sp. COW1]|uniref:TonB-dependent receptor plug domain-containing protein n=1 Tax=Thiohalobacter sp. COW1 TaxID=2795687 RepID=UPI001915EFC4|nr:TonB-dependent receptor [Thiohalobacter sp. COW1]